jgi:hypothetical protein
VHQWTSPQGRKSNTAAPPAVLALLLLLQEVLPVCTLAVGLSPVGVSPVGVSPVAVSPVHFSRRLQLSIWGCTASAWRPLARYRVNLPA